MRRVSYRFLYIFVLFILSAGFLETTYGQVSRIPGQQGRTGIPGQSQTFSLLDSTGTDSITEEINIPPEWYYVDRNELFQHKNHLISPNFNVALLPVWDETELTDGFVTSLGQIGKPYRVLHHGFSEDIWDRGLWKNPVTGHYNRYVLDATHAPFYLDTHTPYINIRFAQAARQTDWAEVTISRNISPRWNALFFLQRRRSVGTYLHHETDHQNFFLSTQYRSQNDRYHLFLTGSFNEMSDQINGGLYLGPDSVYQIQDGFLQQNDSLLDQVYSRSKEEARLLLNGNEGKTFLRSIALDQYYHLIGKPDSASVHRLTLRVGAHYEMSRYRYDDPSISNSDSSFLLLQPVPVYPSGNPDTSAVKLSWRTDETLLRGEASYTFNGPFRLHVDGGYTYTRLVWNQDTSKVEQDILEQRLRGQISIPRISAEIELKQRVSSLYELENRLSLRGRFEPLGARPMYRPGKKMLQDSIPQDSVLQEPDNIADVEVPSQSPLQLDLSYDIFSLNPNIIQTHLERTSTYGFTAQSLDNYNVFHTSASITYTPPARITPKDTLLPNYAGAEVFFSRKGKPIYYTDNMEVMQAPDGTNINWVGASFRYRWHLFDKFYTSGRFTVQEGSSSASAEDVLSRYAERAPLFYGKASVFYDNRSLSIAKIMRIGLDVSWQTSFTGFAMDVPTREFFPTNYEIPAYIKADAYFSLHIKRTYVFFKYTHINEGVFAPAYFTTALYPMLERTLSFGVNWTFYD